METRSFQRMTIRTYGLIAFLGLACSVTGVAAAADMTLRVATWDGPQGQIPIKDALKDFEETHPGVAAQLEQIDSYGDKVVAQLAAGAGPDVFMVGDWDYAKWQKAGLTANLSPLMRRDNFDTGMFIPQLLENHRAIDGNIYSLPKDFSTLGVYYNKTLLNEAGVAYPEPNWTWTQALDMAKKLTKVNSDGSVNIWGLSANATWDAIQWSFAWGNQQRLFDEKYTTVRGYLDDPKTIDAIQFYFDLFHVHRVAPNPQELGALKGDSAAFAARKAAILLWGNWGISDWRTMADFDFGTAVPPSYGKNSTTFLMEAGWALNPFIKDPKRAELAWQLVKHLGGPRGQYFMGRNFWAMPSIPSVAREIGMVSDKYYGAFFQAAYSSMPTYWTKIPSFGNNFNDLWHPMAEAVARGQKGLRTGVSEILDAADRNLKAAFAAN